MTSKTGLVKKCGVMVVNLRVHTLEARKQGLASTFGVMGPATTENGWRTKSVAMGNTHGRTKEFMWGYGLKMLWTHMGSTAGQMADCMWANIRMIRNMVMAFMCGQTAKNTLVNGTKVSSMALESI